MKICGFQVRFQRRVGVEVEAGVEAEKGVGVAAAAGRRVGRSPR